MTRGWSSAISFFKLPASSSSSSSSSNSSSSSSSGSGSGSGRRSGSIACEAKIETDKVEDCIQWSTSLTDTIEFSSPRVNVLWKIVSLRVGYRFLRGSQYNIRPVIPKNIYETMKKYIWFWGGPGSLFSIYFWSIFIF